MSEASLIDEIAELGIDEESWQALIVLPLAEVAWADGVVHPRERAAVLEIATTRLSLGPKGHALLETWLSDRPTAGFLLRARLVLLLLAERARGLRGQSEAPLPVVVDLCADVAQSAGGLFGYGSVSRLEREAIAQIADTLRVRRDRLWEDDDGTEEAPTDVGGLFRHPAAPPPVEDNAPPTVGRGVLRRNDRTYEAEVPRGGELTVGRGRGNGIQVLDDGEVSRNHCRFWERDGQFHVEDRGSMNGTRVNGAPISSVRLHGGEKLGIGLAEWAFVVES